MNNTFDLQKKVIPFYLSREGIIMYTTIDDLVDNYKNFLNDKYPAHIKKHFCDRLASHPAGAKAEAVAFYFFRSNVDEVQIEETSVEGGADFRCKIQKSEFVAEVTSLDAEAVAKASGLKNEIPETGSVGSYSWITHLLRTNASDKTSQMSGYCCPRILVMTSDHVDAGNLLSSKIAAEFLLTSDTCISIPYPLATPRPDLGLETNLADSVFFREKNGEFESCRQSISVILLCSILGNAMKVVGILHPDPIHKFPIKFLPSIPFVRLKKWPPEHDRIGTEWVTHEQMDGTMSEAFTFYYIV